MMAESPTARARRKDVAVRLADVLWGAGTRTNEDFADLAEVDWTLSVSTAAGLERAAAKAEDRKPEWTPSVDYTPSDRTRELVATLISYRARTAATEVDVFAGLPGVDD